MEKNNGKPVAMVIFGITGDLTRRKLVPALYQLLAEGHLPAPLHIIGFARRQWGVEELRQHLAQAVHEHARIQPVNEKALNDLLSTIKNIQSTFEDSKGYEQLKRLLDDLGQVNRLYYLAAPPNEYEVIARHLGDACLSSAPDVWTRIVVEKPYGRDLESARELDEEMHKVFQEDQVYRIDHYLGKETVQNIIVFRFGNGIFEPLWNRYYVDHVQVTVAESVGVEGRAGYYETAGVSRDIFQNHLLQLLTLMAMEAPSAFTADAVRDEKLKVLHSLRGWTGDEVLENTFRAQYGPGVVEGKRVPGYREEKGVDPHSTTETLMAARLFVDNWRWAGVPFYLRSGKRLAQRITEIAVQFRQTPLKLFNWHNMAGKCPNRLILNIQPDEGISLTFGAKAPGPMTNIEPVRMRFDYVKTFGEEPPSAYERLLLDAMTGDATLFTRSDEVLAAWAITTDILNSWKEHPVQNLPQYPAGTWGPPGLDEFIQRDGREWCLYEDEEQPG